MGDCARLGLRQMNSIGTAGIRKFRVVCNEHGQSPRARDLEQSERKRMTGVAHARAHNHNAAARQGASRRKRIVQPLIVRHQDDQR